MKLRAPEYISVPFSHRGQLLRPGDDGCLDLDAGDAEALLAHGFRPDGEPAAQASAFAALTREDLVARALDLTQAALAALSTEDLRARLSAAAPAETALAEESRAAGVVVDAEADAEDVERMSRIELFAFLRARGVGVALPIRNDDLRARARAARVATSEAE